MPKLPTDDNGKPILDADGKPMLCPAGIDLYAGAHGMTSDPINMAANGYASKNSTYSPDQDMDTQFQSLPAQNVDNAALGVSLATVGGGLGVRCCDRDIAYPGCSSQSASQGESE